MSGEMNQSTGINPLPLDIICGRGKKSKDQAGNARFHSFIRKYKEAYRAADTKDEKTRISLTVLEEIRSASPSGDGTSRFIKFTENKGWVEIGDAAAREKISQALREALNQRPPPVRSKKPTRRVDEAKFKHLICVQKDIYLKLCDDEDLDSVSTESDSSGDEGFMNQPKVKKQKLFLSLSSAGSSASAWSTGT